MGLSKKSCVEEESKFRGMFPKLRSDSRETSVRTSLSQALIQRGASFSLECSFKNAENVVRNCVIPA